MKEWKKTTLTWGGRYRDWITSIPVDDLEGCGPHQINSMKIVSTFQESGRRQAVAMFRVIRGVVGPTTKRKEIVKILETIPTPTGHIWIMENGISADFKILFDLRGKFCEEALEFMRNFFKALEIDDPKQFRLGDFSIRQESFIQEGDGWIPFEVYFKLQHGLRVRDLKIEQMPSIHRA